MEKDIVDLLKSEDWHILVTWTVWTTKDFQRYYRMATHMDTGREEDQKKKWLDNIREDCEDMNMSILQASRLSWYQTKWRTTYKKWVAGARVQSHRRLGHKWSKTTVINDLLRQ